MMGRPRWQRGAGIAWVLSLALALALQMGAVAAAPTTRDVRIEGTVVRVIDGDSLLLRTAVATSPPLEVRLQGIDAPEGCQAGGPAAREMLAGFVLDRTVTAVSRGRDHYGRTLATIEVDGLNVNQRMVAEGHAWSLRTRWDRGPYVAQERMAQALQRGLHAEAGAEKPADFRRRHGPCGGPAPAAPGAGRSTQGAAPAATETRAAPERAAPAAAATAGFRCDGRTLCSQMRSCEEATLFLQNCPGVKMDGNRDGVPCERQWCGR